MMMMMICMYCKRGKRLRSLLLARTFMIQCSYQITRFCRGDKSTSGNKRERREKRTKERERDAILIGGKKRRKWIGWKKREKKAGISLSTALSISGSARHQITPFLSRLKRTGFPLASLRRG